MPSTKKNAPLNIVFYEPYPMGLGGNFLTQKLILERLDRQTFNPIIISPREGIALERYRSMSISCEVIAPPQILNKYGGTIFKLGVFAKAKAVVHLLRYNFKLFRYLRDNDVNIVYTNCVRAQVSIGLGALMARIPTTLYVKGELVNPIIDRISIFSASKILFFSKQNRDDRYRFLMKIFGWKTFILPIGMDLSSLNNVSYQNEKQLKSDLNFVSSKTNVIVVGQLYRPKGQHFVLEAFGLIKDDFPDCHLFLLGDHVLEEFRCYKAELEMLISQKGLSDRVSFLGWRDDPLEVVKLMDIVIHPSLAEGFGRAVLEAMALGKPVIASAVGGLRDAISHCENGFLIHPGDIVGIEKYWRELLTYPERRSKLGFNARITVRERFQIDDKVKKISEIWLRLA